MPLPNSRGTAPAQAAPAPVAPALLATLAALSAALVVASALADATWNAVVPPAQQTPLNVRMEVTVPLAGIGSDQDMAPANLIGNCAARLIPAQPPFTEARFVTLHFDLADASLDFQMYCETVLGCQDYMVHVAETHVVLAEPTTVALDPATGAFSLTGQFNALFIAHLTGSAVSDFNLSGPISTTVSGRIAVEGGTARLMDISMAEFLFPIPPSAFPPGVTGTVYIRPLFTAENRMVGPWSATVVGDLTSDGLVNGVDLAALLSAWGSSDPAADLNGDGTVSALDLGSLLGNWTP